MARVLNNSYRERLVAEEFNVTRRMARNYIYRAREEISKGQAATRPERREALRHTFESIMASAVADGDRKNAIFAGREIAKLEGLDEPEVHRHEISGVMGLGLAIEPDPDKAQARLAELRVKQSLKP
jgi:hypothetical protein